VDLDRRSPKSIPKHKFTAGLTRNTASTLRVEHNQALNPGSKYFTGVQGARDTREKREDISDVDMLSECIL
jgi:hypothetical protein